MKEIAGIRLTTPEEIASFNRMAQARRVMIYSAVDSVRLDREACVPSVVVVLELPDDENVRFQFVSRDEVQGFVLGLIQASCLTFPNTDPGSVLDAVEKDATLAAIRDVLERAQKVSGG